MSNEWLEAQRYEEGRTNTPHTHVKQVKEQDKQLSKKLEIESKAEFKMDIGSMNLQQIRRIAKNIVQNWNVPTNIIVFIANTIQDHELGRILPWPYFKRVIFDIYTEKIKDSSELYGALNTNYVPLEEYTILYMLKKHKMRRIAELKLIEFLSSLKYYIPIWARAKTFAQLSGLLRITDSMETDSDQFSADIFLQDYFLTAFSLFVKGGKQSLADTEGSTNIKVEKEAENTVLLLPWMSMEEKIKWTQRMKRFIFKPEESESQQIDLDVLLALYIEEFLSKKHDIQKKIIKNFSKGFQNHEGIFSTDEITTILTGTGPGKSLSPFVSFPSNISFIRSFLFALTSSENGFKIKSKDFVHGCSKYGLDSPFPSVAARIYMFGTDKDLQDIIRNTLLDYKSGNLSLLHGSSGRGSSKSTAILSPLSKEVNVGEEKKELSADVKASSTLLTQHFSIIRDLKQKCMMLKSKFEGEENVTLLWQVFGDISHVLNQACQFLDFPIDFKLT